MGTPTFMEGELFGAAVEGDVRVLSEENVAKHGDAYYKDQTTPRHNNIVHIAAEHARAEFIDVALARFPVLGSRKNDNGDTPLHVASRKGYDEIVKLLVSFGGCDAITMQNLQGDTPLHLALSNNKLRVAMNLLQAGSPVVLSLLNACQETPLHVFLKYCVGTHTTAEALLDEGVLNLQGVYNTKNHIATRESLSSAMIEAVLSGLLRCKSVTYMPDADGLTPLLIAAQRGSFLALQHILNHCPQCAEICDPQGRTVLHHLRSRMTIPSHKHLYDNDQRLDDEPKAGSGFQSICYGELKNLLNVPEIDAIKDSRDSQGNTPAHVAVANGDFLLVKVLFECFSDFTIKNRSGVSALDLIKSFPDFATKMEEVIVTERVMSQEMDEKLFKAAKEGDSKIFEGIETDIESRKVTYNGGDCDFFFRRTSQGLSILHLAVKNGHKEFILKVIEHFPTLVLTADLSGENPLHVGARLKKAPYSAVRTLLQHTKDRVDKFKEEVGPLFLNSLPWRQKNSKGNTPLHEALRSSNYDMAIELMKIDSELPSFENNAGETPLHILARYSTYTNSDRIGALVKLLIPPNESVAYKRDSHGFTPLLTATYCGRIRVAYWIICNCPASVQLWDPKGRNFLHLLRLEPTAELSAMTVEDMLYVYTNILVLTSEAEVDGCQGPVLTPLHKYKHLRKLTGGEFDTLRSSQDHDGNTPLHFALRNKNFATAKFLLHWCLKSAARQEMNIINNEGQSVSNLLELLSNDAPYVKELKELASLTQKKIKEEAFGKRRMDSRVYRLVVEGKVNPADLNLEDEALDGSNILHIAMQYRQIELAKKLMDLYPDLMWERNSNGDTPLHIAAKLCERDGVFDLYEAQWEKTWDKYLCGLASKEEEEEEGLLIIPPYRVKNFQGNTPLHEAANSAYTNFSIFQALDREGATYVNHAGETPFPVAMHLYDYNPNAEFCMSVRDEEGLTPLLRAAKVGSIRVVDQILRRWPEYAHMRDHRGRSFLHLLRISEEDEESAKRLLFEPPKIVDAFRYMVDFDGNTPLHSAIQNGNPVLAKLLAQRCFKVDARGMAILQLEARNKEGQSVLDLVALHDDAPTEVEQLLINKSMGMHGLYKRGGWARSAYGVCKSQIKEMANTLSVVAGLLATITFAAAFQVPGGFGDTGPPILLRRAAFKVFMVSNSLAMCGSMAVLFFLLWVMFTGSAVKSFLLLDLSIAVLQLSFAATLVAFMTGVYVAISSESLWLAIFICAIGSTVVVLMRKNCILQITRCIRLLLWGIGLCKFCLMAVLEIPKDWPVI